MLIAIEGIDGAGKSVILEACAKEFETRGKSVLDLRKLLPEKGYPDFDTILQHDVLLCQEPTHSPMGRKVREMLKVNSPPKILAEYFDMDRSELYIKAVIPALEEKKIVIQERTLLSSLVYQGAEGMDWKDILDLPGNRKALLYPPDLVLLADLPVETAMKRLSKREKNDFAVYENADFLKQVRKGYLGPRFEQFLERRDASLRIINTAKTAAGTRLKVEETLKDFLKD